MVALGCVEWVFINHQDSGDIWSGIAPAFATCTVVAVHFSVLFASGYSFVPEGWLARLKRYLVADPNHIESAQRFTATVLSGLFVCGLSGTIGWLSTQVTHQFVRADLAQGFGALVGVGGVCICLIGFSAARSLLIRTSSKYAPNAKVLGVPMAVLPISLVVAVAVVAWCYIDGIDLSRWSIHRLSPLFWLSAVLGVVLGWKEGLLTSMHRQLRVIAALLVLLGGIILFQSQGWSVVKKATRDTGHIAYLGLSLLHSYTDRDGDGFASAFGGQDCDDNNAQVGPHAIEVPGDGIDNNCLGGDAKSGGTTAIKPSHSDVKTTAQAPSFNIVFVLIDTVRASHLSLYGYTRKTSPKLDAWAQQATVFDRAYAQAPNTPRSIPSMLTGRYPSRIEWENVFTNYSLPKPDQDNMLSHFKSKGWRTEAVSAHWYFEKVPQLKTWAHRWDNSGYTDIAKSYTQITSPQITKRAINRLNQLSSEQKPFFLLVHYFDPHSQYHNHREYVDFDPKSNADYYDTELTFTDHHMAPVFDRLNQADLAHNTIVIITSDHGEAFGEHGYDFHGRSVFEEEIRIPLVIRHPNIAPRRVTTPVGLVDLFATLDQMHGGAESRGDGHSLVDLMKDESNARRSVLFSEQLPYPSFKEYLVAGIDPSSQSKVIYDLTGNQRLFFDLSQDPAEQSPRSESNTPQETSLGRATSRFIENL